MESLDEIFADPVDESLVLDAVESKLFGIGTESCTVGSHDFYLTYAARRNKAVCLDMGHFHPTESIADKLSAILVQQGQILLHVSRGVRWDSDHVIALNDDLLNLGREVAACGTERIEIGLDYFDATINRVGAWVIGTHNMRKALLRGFLEPVTAISVCRRRRKPSRGTRYGITTANSMIFRTPTLSSNGSACMKNRSNSGAADKIHACGRRAFLRGPASRINSTAHT